MSSNEIANHIEAVCWLRLGPLEDPLLDPPPLYFRSQSGFLDRIGVIDISDPLFAPSCFLQLDRYYTRAETAVFAFVPTTADGDAGNVLRPGPAGVIVAANPTVVPFDSRLIYGELPSTPENISAAYETFNGFIIAPFGINVPLEGDVALDPSYFDLCIQLIRVPRRDATVSYKEQAAAP